MTKLRWYRRLYYSLRNWVAYQESHVLTPQMLAMFKQGEDPHEALTELVLGTCGLATKGLSVEGVYLTPAQKDVKTDVEEAGFEVGLRASWL